MPRPPGVAADGHPPRRRCSHPFLSHLVEDFRVGRAALSLRRGRGLARGVGGAEGHGQTSQVAAHPLRTR
eukprot:11169631-Lingulodinium_polyedra.AAC.1